MRSANSCKPKHHWHKVINDAPFINFYLSYLAVLALGKNIFGILVILTSLPELSA